MKWFRVYDDLLDDPKVQQLPPVLFKHWVNILCIASKNDPRGLLPDLNAVAFRLRLSHAKTQKILADLGKAGLLDVVEDSLSPHNWNGRQQQSDDVRKRVQRHRERQVETLQETLQDTLPQRAREDRKNEETETETEIDASKKPPADPAGFREFWSAYPKKEDRKQAVEQWKRLKPGQELIDEILAAVEAQKQGRKWQEGFIKAPHRWIRDKNWLDEPEPPRPIPIRSTTRAEKQQSALDYFIQHAREQS